MYDDAQDALAAEYVLGTLTADEREHAEALLEIDPGFAESVQVWERRLGELNVMVEAVEPPAEVWDKIRGELGDVAAPSDIPWADAGPLPPPLPAGSAVPPPLPLPSAGAAPPPLPTAISDPITDEHAAPAMDLASSASDDLFEDLKDEPSTVVAPKDAIAPSDAVDDDVAQSIAAALAKSPVEPTEPAPGLPRGPAARSAEIVYLRNRVSLWRTVAIATEAIAALLAIYVAAAQFYPALIPLRGSSGGTQVAQAPAPAAGELGGRMVAVLQHEPTSPAFLVTIDQRSRTMIVRRVSGAADAGRSYELWLISKQFPAPRSLGLVGKDEFTQRPIPASYDVGTLRAANYAVSLEPAGGSPSGVPTGPVLFTGRMLEAVPASAPPPSRPKT
jgi:anti-sigma-K factor RskA